MYPVSTPEVIILRRVRESAQAAARLERMMGCIRADRVTETDDDGLAGLVTARGWDGAPARTGQYRMTRHPAIIFNAFRWLTPAEFESLAAKWPSLQRHMLLGRGPWGYRDHTRLRLRQDCICQSAWEFHCAYGCLHACDYCHAPPYFNVMLNLEDLAARIRAFGETIPGQGLYKFDNYTDTITLEPEYGASEVMVRAFADWPGRYLLLYTKSDNVDHLLGLAHGGHTLISWSLNCETAAREIEKGTPPLGARLSAMQRCQAAGYPVRARISPMCPVKGWREEYRDLMERLLGQVRPQVISLDVVGWMSAAQMRDALDTSLFDEEYAAELERLAAAGFAPDGKHLFPHALRAAMLRHVIEQALRVRPDQPISLCMETADMWREMAPLLGMSAGRYACCCGPTSVPGHPLLERATA